MKQRPASLLLLLLLLSGCSKDLSRSRTADLVKAYPKFAAPVIALPLQEQELYKYGLNRDAGVIEGLWTKSLLGNFATRYNLTPKGQQYFARTFTQPEPMPLAQPARRELLEVTGITTPPMGGEATRVANFTWKYADLSPVAARYAGETSVTHKGEALFQLFDDGWRVQELDLHEREDRVPFQWTAELEQQAQQSPNAGTAPAAPTAARPTAAVVSVGGFSDGAVQLELWQDDSANGQLLGRISFFSQDMSKNPKVGELESITGNGTTGELGFKSKLRGEEVSFAGTVRGNVVQGRLHSTSDKNPFDLELHRLEKEYEKNYPTRQDWSKEMAEQLACCGPSSTEMP